ncbi:MAG: translocation/assembly module TamB domain-containing protein [Bacteroidaceae bacterium]|nr:translocation/assembly module TamB domain-containing protein [Bacteroidaceae bacterium]
MPFVTEAIARKVSALLSEKLRTEVRVGQVEVRPFRQIFVRDVLVRDQRSDTLVAARTLSVHLDLLPLLQNELVIKHMGLFNASVRFSKDSVNSKPNYQFILDNLASDQGDEKARIKFSARSFICRDIQIRYDVADQPQTPRKLNLSHVALRNLDANFRINYFAQDSIDIRVRNIRFREQSGLAVEKTLLKCVLADNRLHVHDMRLDMAQTHLRIAQADVVLKPQIRIRHAQVNGLLCPSDFVCLSDEAKQFANDRFQLDVVADGKGQDLDVQTRMHEKAQQSMGLVATVRLDQGIWNRQPIRVSAHVEQLRATPAFYEKALALFTQDESLRQRLTKLGQVEHSGEIHVDGENIHVTGNTTTELGKLEESLTLKGRQLDGHLAYRDFLVDQLAQVEALPRSPQASHGTAMVSGCLQPLSLHFTHRGEQLFYNGYAYHNVNVEATWADNKLNADLHVDDENLKLASQVRLTTGRQGASDMQAQARVDKLSLRALHLTDRYDDVVLSAQVAASLYGNPDRILSVTVHDFKADNIPHPVAFDSLRVKLRQGANSQDLVVASDMLDAHVRSSVPIQNAPDAMFSFMSAAFPSLGNYVKFAPVQHPNLDFQFKVRKTDVLAYFLNLPLSVKQEATVSGFVDHDKNQINLTAWMPKFTINDEPYADASMYLKGNRDSLHVLSQLTKSFDDTDVRMVLNTQVADNTIAPVLDWKTINSNGTSGNVAARCQFSKDNADDRIADILIQPSRVFIKDTLWSVSSSHVEWNKGNVHISPLEIRNGSQYISLSRAKGSGEPYKVDINDIEIAHIQDLLNFHPVEFSGKATGTAFIPTEVDRRDIPVRLTVQDFRFQDGRMGTLRVKALWDGEEGAVHIDGLTRRSLQDSLWIHGRVDIANDSIDLSFEAHRTSLEFLNSWLEGVLGHIEGTTTGHLRLHGPLSGMDFEGCEHVDTMTFRPPFNNAPYMVTHDSVRFAEGRIIFEDFHIKDLRGGSCTAVGQVTHNKIKDFGYDIRFDANNLLAYNWREGASQDIFWGVIHANGDGRLWGNTSNVHAELNLSPTPGSVFCYNSSDEETAAASTDFIRFHDSYKSPSGFSGGDAVTVAAQNSMRDSTVNIFLHINANVNPNAQIVIYTDRRTGDGLTLHGNGPISASWHNKGRFQLTGLYTTTEGEYHLTIQDLMRRTFRIQPGGFLRFSGSAEDGDLNLKGVYSVHSVSLSDLNLGQNISNATTSVDCLLNFGGKCNNPQVTFGLDFPTAGDDLRQTIHSAISSQEDMNMQMLYLLTIGRFYTYDYTNMANSSTMNQSTLAMQSLFANTLGNSLGSVISQALHLTNWTFGPNIATGRMGWDDMEVGGQLQGSLLQNRLQLRGNFGYREQTTYANNFVGDFNIRYLLNPKGTVSLKAYSETNDRYFSRSSLSTQGGGIQFQHDFNNARKLFKKSPKGKKK